MLTGMQAHYMSYVHDTAQSFPSSRHQLVEDRAYLIWVTKGHPEGTALDDWLKAEVDIDTQLQRGTWSFLCRTRW
jgi:hypothetical protein